MLRGSDEIAWQAGCGPWDICLTVLVYSTGKDGVNPKRFSFVETQAFIYVWL